MTLDTDTLYREARTWEGTPYRHGQASRYGCDCIGLLIGMAKSLGILPQAWQPAPYTRQYHLHSDEERLCQGIEALGGQRLPLTALAPGHIVLLRYGLSGSHACSFQAHSLCMPA